MLNDTTRCTGLTRDLRTAPMVPVSVVNMPDGECMHRIAGQ